MTGPDRIWAFDCDLQDNDGTWRNWQCWSEDHPKPLNATEYVRRDPAVLAALPEVQAMIAAAYEDGARRLAANRAHLNYTALICLFNGAPLPEPIVTALSNWLDGIASAIRALTPADATAALAARDAAMIARGMREDLTFDGADWFWRVMDPDDNGDNPSEAITRGYIGQFTVCEIACSYRGPTRFGFNAPVLDHESDEDEFLHFETQHEAIDAAKDRRAAILARAAEIERESGA